MFRQFMSDDGAPVDDVHETIRERLRALAPEQVLRFEPYRFHDDSGPRVLAQGACPKLTLAAARVRSRDQLASLLVSLETDDPLFDQAFEVLGSPALVYAVLDDRTRAALLAFVRRHGVLGIAVVKGDLQVLLRQRAAKDADLVQSIAAEALALVGSLGTPDDVPARLARNAVGSARPEVRARQLATLVRHHPELDATRAALLAAAKDASAEVRLLAGQGLGDEGRTLLAALAAASDTPDAIAARAVDSLKGTLPVDDGTALLARGPLLARACLSGFVRGVAEGAAAQGAAEAAIAAALGSRDAGVRAAAIDALAQVGGASAVALLEDRAAREGGDLRRAARGAIAAIQSRLVGAGRGQVSLADHESGQLSVAATKVGDLSLPDRTGDPDH